MSTSTKWVRSSLCLSLLRVSMEAGGRPQDAPALPAMLTSLRPALLPSRATTQNPRADRFGVVARTPPVGPVALDWNPSLVT